MSKLTLPTRYYRRFPPVAHLGYIEEDVEIDLARTVFLVVDVYGLGFAPEEESRAAPSLVTADSVHIERDIVVNHLRPATDAARRIGLPVVYTSNAAPRIALERYEFCEQRKRNAKHDFKKVFAELPIDPREYEYGDSDMIKYSRVVAPQPGDYFVRKIVYSSFFETRLDSLLRHLDADTLVCVGFSASECLIGTMMDAFNRDYRLIILRDCTLATETIPAEEATSAFTRRMVLWMETYIASSSTSQHFIAACAALKSDIPTEGSLEGA